MNHTNYDLIGDIHGQEAALRGLLGQLGYDEIAGAFRHPTRRAIFLGDFIDRGPRIRETLHLVRAMLDAGSALAVMGNHEYNALCMHTRSPDGAWLMDRENKLKHHQSTIDAFAGREEEWRGWLEWMFALPVALDLGGLRVVHAAWDEALLATLPTDWRITPDYLVATRVPDSGAWTTAEILLKGREAQLPAGYKFTDKSGIARHKVRVRWWLPPEGRTFAEVCLPHCPTVPELPLNGEGNWSGYPSEAPPVMLGHYWLRPESIAPLAPNIGCVDYSVAGGGPLVAYRWDGERVLDPAKYVLGPRGK